MRCRRPATAEAGIAALEDGPGDKPGEDPGYEPEVGPLRCCVVTRRQGERARMLRFVVGPGQVIVPDLAAKLPGRGIWLSAVKDVIETARSRGAFAKAARAQVQVPPDLPDVLADGLRQRISDTLGLARRAGQAVAGFQKAQGWLLAMRAGLVVQAADGSAEERQRFLGHWPGPVARPLSAEKLGPVFGRDQAVHVAVASGRLAQALIADTERLAGLLGQPDMMAQAVARVERAGL